jgi:hypothetical protein
LYKNAPVCIWKENTLFSFDFIHNVWLIYREELDSRQWCLNLFYVTFVDANMEHNQSKYMSRNV